MASQSLPVFSIQRLGMTGTIYLVAADDLVQANVLVDQAEAMAFPNLTELSTEHQRELASLTPRVLESYGLGDIW
jgi:hypothetical protein